MTAVRAGSAVAGVAVTLGAGGLAAITGVGAGACRFYIIATSTCDTVTLVIANTTQIDMILTFFTSQLCPHLKITRTLTYTSLANWIQYSKN